MNNIETERLYLRKLSEDDATEKYANWLNDPHVNRYLETRHSVQSTASCKAFISACNADEASHLFGVFLKETSEHIGNVKIGFIHKLYGSGQISLFIGEKDFWGMGLSTELVKGVTKYGFEILDLQKIEAGCYEDNLASLRIFLKSGYKVEGFLRDQVVIDEKRKGCFWLGVLKHEQN